MIQKSTMEVQKETESRVIIRFQDCDPLQHLNNSKYFDYYFNAREDQVAKLYNFKFSEIFHNHQTSWVVYQQHIAYIRPAMLSEWVKIFSRVIYFDATTIITEFYMTNEDKTQLKSILQVTSKYIDVKTGKKTPHQPEVMSYLKAICVPEITDFDLNNRIRVIKEEIKKMRN